MSHNRQKVSAWGTWLLTAVILNTVVLKFAFTTNPQWYWALVATLPLLWRAWRHGRREQRNRIG